MIIQTEEPKVTDQFFYRYTTNFGSFPNKLLIFTVFSNHTFNIKLYYGKGIYRIEIGDVFPDKIDVITSNITINFKHYSPVEQCKIIRNLKERQIEVLDTEKDFFSINIYPNSE